MFLVVTVRKVVKNYNYLFNCFYSFELITLRKLYYFENSASLQKL